MITRGGRAGRAALALGLLAACVDPVELARRSGRSEAGADASVPVDLGSRDAGPDAGAFDGAADAGARLDLGPPIEDAGPPFGGFTRLLGVGRPFSWIVAGGAVQRTEDDGLSFEPVAIESAAPSDIRKIVDLGEAQWALTARGLRIARDAGRTFLPEDPGFGDAPWLDLVVDGERRFGLVELEAGPSLLRSSGAGGWQLVARGGRALAFAAGRLFLLGDPAGPRWSADGGDTFTTAPLPRGGAPTELARFGARLYLAGPRGVWVSADRGSTFDLLTESPTDGLAVYQGELYVAFARGPPGLARLRAGGNGFSPLSGPRPPPGRLSGLASSGAQLFATHPTAGLWRWRIGDPSWTNASPASAPIDRLAEEGGALFGLREGAVVVHVSEDRGQGWRARYEGLASFVDEGLTAFSAGPAGLLAGTGDPPRVLRSENRGRSWAALGEPVPDLLLGEDRVSALAALDPDTLLVGLAGRWTGNAPGRGQPLGGGLVRSTDGGSTWRLLPSALPGRRGEDGRRAEAEILELLALEGGSMLAAAIGEGAGLHRSTDGGLSWRPSEGGSGLGARVRLAAAEGSAYAASPAGLLRSTDGGLRFTPVSSAGAGGFRDVSAAGRVVAAVNDAGRLVLSRDGGASFESFDLGAPARAVVVGAEGWVTAVLAGRGARVLAPP